MKICVTSIGRDLNAQVDPRFGRCQYFVFVDSDTMTFEAMPNDAIAAPGGAGIQAAQTVVNKGANMLISGNIGPNAFQVLSTAGVKVATGVNGTVKEAVEMYKNGGLSETGTSTVAAHAGMGVDLQGIGMGGGRGGGRGRGMGRGMQQPMPSQAQAPQATIAPKTKDEELEQLSDMASRLEKDLEEVKKKIEELKRR
jgi:predicted Fe-Mo cluster-binding NifX family protein